MKVVELGCGVCGLVCAEHLAKNPKVDSLVLADLKVDAAKRLADRLKDDKVTVKKVDGTDPKAVRSLLKKCDIVVATMPWHLNKIVLEISAEVGTDYVDFGMPLDSTGPEFDRLSQMCRDGGTAGMVGMGMEPGISDVFAMYGASKLDRADEAHVYDGDSGAVEGIEFFSTWSPVDLFDEMSVPAAVFRNGKIEFIPPLSAREMYDFPEPVGRRPVYKTNHDETYFMPMGIKTLKNASFNIHIDDNFAHAADILRRFGLLRKEPVNVKGVSVKPLDLMAAMLPSPVNLADQIKGDACFVVEVIGEKGGKRSKMKIWTMTSYEEAYRTLRTNATGYMVGTGGAVATDMLIDGEVKEKGLVIPEQLSFGSYLARLKGKGLEIREEFIPL
jgi:saccharopine dehydrogenase-like NADP-dependent oxidoreductase